MLTDLLFADNPWWLGKEVPPPSRLLPLSEGPGVQRLWIPAGGVSPSDLKGMAYGWTKRWGQYSALLLDLSRVEVSPEIVEEALDFYGSRLYASSERHLLIVNAAHWTQESLIDEFVDGTYTVLLVYNVIPDRPHRVILPYYPDSPSPGDVREAFWSGDLERAKALFSGYGKALKRKVRAYFWRYVVGFPPDEGAYFMVRSMYSLIHQYYDIRDKDLFRRVFSHLVGVAGGRLKFRETSEALNVRFETLRAFLDQIISVGLLYELKHVNRDSPRSPRMLFNANGQFHHLLKHTDPKDVLLLDENSPDVLPFLIPYILGKAMERGVEVAFEDDGGRHLRFQTDRPFTVRLGEDVPFLDIVGLL